MPQDRARFAIADLTLAAAKGSERAKAYFTVADHVIFEPPDPEYDFARFSVADVTVNALDGTETGIARFVVGDEVIFEPPPVWYDAARFSIGDLTLIALEDVPETVALFSVAEVLTIPAVPPPPEIPEYHVARFVVSDHNIIVNPSPEKLRVWDTVKQQWVHAPRYIWHADPGEWRQLS